MQDLLRGRVDEKDPAGQHDDAVKVELTGHDSGMKAEDRILEVPNDVHQGEEQDNPQHDGDADAEAPDHRLLVRGRLLGFHGYVEQVVEPQDRLEQRQEAQGHDVVDGQDVSHGALPAARPLAMAQPNARPRAGAKRPDRSAGSDFGL